MSSLFSPVPFDKINALVLRVTAFCWLMAKLIGWRMFTTCRIFPTAPVLNIFDRLPATFHTLLFALSILLLGMLLVNPTKKIFLLSLLLCETLSFLLDQNRVQPWDYQYLFILFICLVNKSNAGKAINVFLFILAATYIYGGLGKLNGGFLHTIWTKMLLEQFLHLPTKSVLQPWVQTLGYSVGLLEVILGFGVLFEKSRKIAASLLVLMHVFILLFLGPLGLKYNMVVWPWNVAMIFYLYLLCFRTEKPLELITQLFGGANLAVFVFWGILPALNFVGWWDNYLSSGVYTGKLPEMVICIRDTSKCRPLQRYCINGQRGYCNGAEMINLQYWSMAETKMAPYPEMRAYKKIQAKLEKQYPDAGFSFTYFNGK